MRNSYRKRFFFLMWRPPTAVKVLYIACKTLMQSSRKLQINGILFFQKKKIDKFTTQLQTKYFQKFLNGRIVSQSLYSTRCRYGVCNMLCPILILNTVQKLDTLQQTPGMIDKTTQEPIYVHWLYKLSPASFQVKKINQVLYVQKFLDPIH